jgi:hypothetical protein
MTCVLLRRNLASDLSLLRKVSITRFRSLATGAITPSGDSIPKVDEMKPSAPTEPTLITPVMPIRIEPKNVIGIFDLGGKLPIKIADLVKRLNSYGSNFRYRELNAVSPLDKYDILHGYSDRHLFDYVKERIHGTDCVCGIGLTHVSLEPQAFNRHDRITWRHGVVSYYDYRKYTPIDRDLEQYLVYLILCESFCLVGKMHFEHDEQDYCLFDMCIHKEDLKHCLHNPKIVDGTNKCRTILRDRGFRAEDLEAADRMLNFVGSLKWKRLLSSLFTASTALLLGVLIREALTYAPKLSEELTIAFDLILLMLLICSVIYSWSKAREVPEY